MLDSIFPQYIVCSVLDLHLISHDEILYAK